MIRDFDTNEVLLTVPLDGSDGFEIDFIHSVNLSNVKEIYSIEGQTIVCHTLVYSAFGAGMPTEIEPPLEMHYDDDNNMVVTGYDIRMTELPVMISIPHDHILTVGDRAYSLGTLVGHGKTVNISVGK